MSEPPWHVELSPGAVRSLQRLPEKVATAVVEFITVTLPSNPLRLSKPLRYELEGWHVARRGDYRVTFEMHDEERVLRVGRVEHRAHVYKRR